MATASRHDARDGFGLVREGFGLVMTLDDGTVHRVVSVVAGRESIAEREIGVISRERAAFVRARHCTHGQDASA